MSEIDELKERARQLVRDRLTEYGYEFEDHGFEEHDGWISSNGMSIAFFPTQMNIPIKDASHVLDIVINYKTSLKFIPVHEMFSDHDISIDFLTAFSCLMALKKDYTSEAELNELTNRRVIVQDGKCLITLSPSDMKKVLMILGDE